MSNVLSQAEVEALTAARKELTNYAYAILAARNVDGYTVAEFVVYTKAASLLFQRAEKITKTLANSNHRYGTWRTAADRTAMTVGCY